MFGPFESNLDGGEEIANLTFDASAGLCYVGFLYFNTDAVSLAAHRSD